MRAAELVTSVEWTRGLILHQKFVVLAPCQIASSVRAGATLMLVPRFIAGAHQMLHRCQALRNQGVWVAAVTMLAWDAFGSWDRPLEC